VKRLGVVGSDGVGPHLRARTPRSRGARVGGSDTPSRPSMRRWGLVQIVPLIRGPLTWPPAPRSSSARCATCPRARGVRRGPAAKQPRHAPLSTSAERRCEQMSGGVRPWTWPELGRQVERPRCGVSQFHFGLRDGLETASCCGTASRASSMPISTVCSWGRSDGTRVPQGLPDAPAWSPASTRAAERGTRWSSWAPIRAVAAGALARGCRPLVVTLGARGAAYFTGDPGQDRADPAEAAPRLTATRRLGRRARRHRRGLAGRGASIEDALRLGTRMGTRNVSHRGATGLRDHLRASSRRCDPARRGPVAVRRSLVRPVRERFCRSRERRRATPVRCACGRVGIPYGLVGLLAAGQAARAAGGGSPERPLLTAPTPRRLPCREQAHQAVRGCPLAAWHRTGVARRLSRLGKSARELVERAIVELRRDLDEPGHTPRACRAGGRADRWRRGGSRCGGPCGSEPQRILDARAADQARPRRWRRARRPSRSGRRQAGARPPRGSARS